ncbi:BglII/BstYI family type II restriction endonuclease [Sporosalibacterium faouarense]|uniref:BglII/BstYI family type II restriction endonuclease n=1 Tax=Sporosalibacterium faouarense TaxID=516123 RepID=UPI00192C35A5|nr:BglII/BstYI family type II restriction endonuclease [Sporosalibacterium faouarense]
MNIKTFSYRYAEEILTHPNHIDIYNEIINICQQAPLPVYKGKSERQKSKDVVQQVLNTYFRLKFTDLGWEAEPLATPNDNHDSLRSDFRKKFPIVKNGNIDEVIVQIEVEFGNIASSYRNYFKFQLSYSYNLTDICILILPCFELSKRIDSGVANFEKTVREIPSAKLSITVPTLVIGLDSVDVSELDVKSIESNLNILKCTRKEYTPKHNEIVRECIEKYNT